jgi:dihydromethanopterin reductase
MINLIVAAGEQGEIGLLGRIPWLNDPKVSAAVKQDMRWFFDLTANGILVVGSATWREMRALGFAKAQRIVAEWDGEQNPETFLRELEEQHLDRDIWICGGERTYRAFLPFVERFYVSRIPWTGPADRFMPPLFPQKREEKS